MYRGFGDLSLNRRRTLMWQKNVVLYSIIFNPLTAAAILYYVTCKHTVSENQNLNDVLIINEGKIGVSVVMLNHFVYYQNCSNFKCCGCLVFFFTIQNFANDDFRDFNRCRFQINSYLPCICTLCKYDLYRTSSLVSGYPLFYVFTLCRYCILLMSTTHKSSNPTSQPQPPTCTRANGAVR